MTKIGDRLTSPNDELPELEVVGGDPAAGKFIVNEVEEPGGPRYLEPDEAAEYGVHAAPVKGDEDAGWRALADSPSRGRRILGDVPLTPEQALARGEATPVAADATDTGEPRRWPRLIFTEDAPWLR